MKASFLYISTLLLIWWAANAMYAVDAERLLKNPSRSILLIIDASICQTLVGMALCCVFHFIRNANLSGIPSPPVQQPSSKFHWAIALFHFGGTLFTNMSYRMLGSTSTLVWKLSEPLAAVLLKHTFLGESTDPFSLLGVAIIVFGILAYSISTITIITISPIFIANIFFPLRNVIVKLDQKTEKGYLSPEMRFYCLLKETLPYCTIIFIFRFLEETPDISYLPHLLYNALWFSCYQMASIALLERLDSLTHSLANSMKRFSGILLSTLLLGESMTSQQIFGFIMMMIGFPLYAEGSGITRYARFSRIALILVIPILLHTFGVFSSATSYPHIASQSFKVQIGDSTTGTTLSTSTRSGRSEKSLPSNLRISSNVSKGFIVTTVNGEIEKPNTYGALLDNEDKYAYRGQNLGNLVWQRAALTALPDFTLSPTCNHTRRICEEESSVNSTDTMVYFIPLANMFDTAGRNGPFKYHRSIIARGDIPLVVGAGLQAKFTEDECGQKDPDLQRKMAEQRLDFHPDGIKLLKDLEEKSIPMLVRGKLTRNLARKSGSNATIAAGCPSLMLNPDAKLGRTMEQKYLALKDRIGDKTLKVAINLQNNPPHVLGYLLRIFEEYPNSVIYAQASNDMISLQKMNVSLSRVKIFTNVDDWKASLEKMDVAFGARIHGNMIALAAGIPVFAIAPDYRVLELVQEMQIPHVSVCHELMSEEKVDVAKVMYEKRLKGEDFDKNRCEKAHIWKETLAKFGIGISEQLRNIAAQC